MSAVVRNFFAVRLPQFFVVFIGGLCVELWAVRAMLRMERRFPALTGIETLPADNLFRDIPLRADLRWEHFALEAVVFLVIPSVILFFAWRWLCRPRDRSQA